MSLEYETISLGEFCFVDSGFAFKSSQFSDNPEDIPLIKGSNLGHRVIEWGDGPWWDATEYDKHQRYQLKAGDVILAMDRPIVGDKLKFAWIQQTDPESLLVQRMARLRAFDPEDQEYLRHVIADPAFQSYIDTITTGVSIPHISGSDIKKYQFPIPPKTVRMKIAGIPSAYDDLIENNLKRIKLLEELAQLTYEQWFVRREFPGYESTPVDPETGLPEGWEKLTLTDFITIKHGYAFKGEFFEDEETTNILLTPGNFKIGGGLKLGKVKYYSEEAPLPEEYVLKTHDLLVTMTDLSKESDTLGYPLLVPSPITKKYLHNQRLGKVEPLNEEIFPRYFLYHLFQDERYRGLVVGSASGTAVKHTSPSRILAFKAPFPLPGKSRLIDLFEEKMEPLYVTIDHLLQQNQLLKEARDILLPRLMTGMIDIDKVVLPDSLLAPEAA